MADGAYIRMCEKAVECGIKANTSGCCRYWFYIKVLKRELPLYITLESDVGTFLHFSNAYRNFELSEYVPIFSQEQLQEMVEDRFDNFLHMNYEAEKWSSLKEQQYLNSMEQLWLAFVMKEKFNKVWDGDDFIVAKGE